MTVKLLSKQHLKFLSLEGGCTGWSESTLVKMLHCWKSHVTAQITIHFLFQLFIEARKVNSSSYPQTLEYIQKSIEVCWYMALQDPPVIIDTTTKTSDSFDSEVFKVYTAKGKSIDFIVWPPLMLNKDGPLIAKGVAQGK